MQYTLGTKIFKKYYFYNHPDPIHLTMKNLDPDPHHATGLEGERGRGGDVCHQILAIFLVARPPPVLLSLSNPFYLEFTENCLNRKYFHIFLARHFFFLVQGERNCFRIFCCDCVVRVGKYLG